LVGNVTIRYCVRKYIKGTQAIQEWQEAHSTCKNTLYYDFNALNST